MSDKNYIHPAQKRQEEHEKRKEKKKKKRGLLWFLLILLLIAALIGGIGFGQGWFDGKGKSEEDTSGSEDPAVERTIPEESQDDSSESPKTPVALKISGSTYIYNDSVRTLEQLKSDFSVLDKSAVIIEITDDNAVANAVQSLHDLLGELGIAYSDIPAVTTAPESSSSAETTTTQAETTPLV